MPHKRVALMAMVTVAASTGCKSNEEVPYEPRQAPSGVKASLPAVPNVPQKPIKAGDAYMADVTDILRDEVAALHEQDAGPGVRKRVHERPSARAAPDDHDVELSAHAVPLP